MQHRPPSSADPRAPRVLLYSHDSVGLGHLRRTLNVAGALERAFPGAVQLLATGSTCATHFATPRGLDIVKLPSVGKAGDGAYASRRLSQSLPSTVALRRELLLGLVRTFAPDVFIVDQKVLGVGDELVDVLAEARRCGARTILGIRDIIDAPDVVAVEWGRPAVRAALVELYDRVLVYGTPEVFDTRIEYPVPPELARTIRFTGYVVPHSRGPLFRAVPLARPRVVVTTGGGEDGGARVAQYLDALALAPYDWSTEIVLGPLLDGDLGADLERRALDLERVSVRSFHPDVPRLVAESDLVCAMAGYNTVAETTRARKQAIYLPRTFPRREQEIRAERFAALGFARAVSSADPRALRAALEDGLAAGRITSELPNMDGAAQVAREVAQLLQIDAALGAAVAEQRRFA